MGYGKVGLLGEKCELDTWQIMRKTLEGASETIGQEAMKLIPQMRTTSVMKPLSIEKDFSKIAEAAVDSVKFVEGFNVAAARPWIIIGSASACTSGPMRWPLPGVPCFLVALDTMIVGGVARIADMLSKNVAIETNQWFSAEESDDHQLKEEDVTPFLLQKGEGIVVPFGHHVQWVFSGDTDKATHGKVVVQWILEEGIEAPQAILREVKHACEKQLVNAGPWSRIKGTIEAWLATVKPVE